MGAIWLSTVILPARDGYAQSLPTPDQLDQLLAPIALYPDALLAQICAASTDPQQILDADNWVRQNPGLSGQARTDAAQQQGFDPAFIALVNFPQVLDRMAQNIDDYAMIGNAFAADQGMVMDSIQRLRQQAYAVGALQSNQHQTVSVENQGNTHVIVVQPANPQVVYVPQYNPQVVFVQPGPGFVAPGPFLTFGPGITLGAWMTNTAYPWGWGGWGWNWGRRNLIVHNNVWVVNNRYRPRRPSYVFRPPAFNRPPIFVRPPNNWRDRPFYRPPAGRPPGQRPPSQGGQRPPSQGGQRPPSQGGQRPPSQAGQRPPSQAGQRPQNRPNPNAGRGSGNPRADSGGRNSAFGGGNNAAADRAASNRGRSSVASQQRQRGGGNRQ